MCTVAEHTLGVLAYTGDGRTGDPFTNASSLSVEWTEAASVSAVSDVWGTVVVSEATPESTVTVSATAASW